MANEKQNNVRILQSTHKKATHPAVHAVWGFFAGAAFIAMALLMYLYLNDRDESKFSSDNHFQEDTAVVSHAEPALPEQAEHPMPQAAPHANEAESEHSPHFSDDLLSAFKHEKPVQPAAQARSPFEHSLTQTSSATVPVAKKTQATERLKNAPVNKPAVKVKAKNDLAKMPAKPALQPALAQQINEPEPDVPSPRASLQVTITKTLSPIKETAAVP
ncbi:hypothetical protein [Acinetobacter sp.]|jgi:hypothetical protein|uniref:hypothetical protein n=1 Tax=Acinetobacter sp. TaxID=472 RepID=UPI0035B3180F